MYNISNRINFLDKITTNGIYEVDMGSVDFKDFEWGDPKYYVTSELDLARPDMISYKIYGTTNYWWLICWLNGISDIWNDIRPEMQLKYYPQETMRKALEYAMK